MVDQKWEGPGILRIGKLEIEPGDAIPADKLDSMSQKNLDEILAEKAKKPKAEDKKGKKK